MAMIILVSASLQGVEALRVATRHVRDFGAALAMSADELASICAEL